MVSCFVANFHCHSISVLEISGYYALYGIGCVYCVTGYNRYGNTLLFIQTIFKASKTCVIHMVGTWGCLVAGFSSREETGGKCMKCYLGYITVSYEEIGDDVVLPHYGGVYFKLGRLKDDVEEAIKGKLAPGDKGLLAVSIKATRTDLLYGLTPNRITILGLVSVPEQAESLWCECANGILTVKDKYCMGAYPANQWPGSMYYNDDELVFVSTVGEWSMDLIPIVTEAKCAVVFICTEVPREVIEARGVDMLGPFWILEARELLYLDEEPKQSKMFTGCWTSGRYVLSDRAKEAAKYDSYPA